MTRIADRPQRRYRRLTVRVEVEYAWRSGRRVGRATTLGAGGMFIESDRPLPEGCPLHLRFRLPGAATLHELRGHVVWRRPPGGTDGPAAGMGVQFSDRAACAPLAHALEALAPTEPAPTGTGAEERAD